METKRRRAWLGVLGLVIGATLAAAPPQADPVPLPDEAFDDFGMRITTGYRSATFVQHFQWGVGGTIVRRTRMERASASDSWVVMDDLQQVPYSVTAVASTDGGEQIFVAGFTDAGTSIVERWSYPPRPSGWAVRTVGPSAAVGAPLPPASVSQSISGASGWQAPNDGDELTAPERTLLFERSTGPINSITADPQGRYLVFHDFGTRQIVQRVLDEQSSQTEQVLLSSEDYPPLLEAVTLVELRDFADEGRKLFVRGEFEEPNPPAIPVRLILPDPDNDGLFEIGPEASAPPIYLGDDIWNLSPYAEWEKWDLYWHG